MLRRLLPTLLTLLVGLAGLAWGLWSLQRIFTEERDDARAALVTHRQVLEQYAHAALRQALREHLALVGPALDTAAEDPLHPAGGLYLSRKGEQLLPRRAVWEEGADTPGQARYVSLRARGFVEEDAEGPWAERLVLARRVDQALARGDARDVNAALASLLQHRARFVLAATKDVPLLLVLIERLQERGDPIPERMQALLREGLSDGRGGRVEGLQRLLLLKRSRFTSGDFSFLRERVTALSSRVGVAAEDFEARVRELEPTARRVPPSVDTPMLLRSGWYLEPAGDGVRGVAADGGQLMEALTRQMRERGLLGEEDTVRLLSDGEEVPLSGLRLSVESPRWLEEETELTQRFLLKTGLVGVCGALGGGIAALAFVAQRRKLRFLQLRSDFVATVSHELRTPLASIRVMAETLERKVAGVVGARDYPTRIMRETDGLTFLVENLLSFNRIDKGRWVPRLGPVRLEEVLAAVGRDARAWSTVPVELASDVGDHELWADAQLLRLLFANLARNGCAYNTRRPVQLGVELRPGGRVLFRDNGVGIPPGAWERIFGEFERLSGNGPEVHGSGLGLALCRRIMALHGGTLRVAASSTEGTTFELLFPERKA